MATPTGKSRLLKHAFTILLCLLNVYVTNNKVFAQSCCYTDTLIINTGYDPTTNTAVAFGINGGTPVPDPHWNVCFLHSDYHSDIVASTTPTLTPVAVTGPADVIGTVAGWGIFPAAGAGGPGNWINCFNSTSFNHIVSAHVYTWIVSRTFTLICKSDVTFDLHVSVDNYMDNGYIDDICLGGTSNPIPDANHLHSHTSSFYNLNSGPFTVSGLAAGPHTISFTLSNDKNGPPNNSGVAIYGTVSTPSAFLVPEGTCSNYAVCPKNGPNVCVGSTVTLSSSSTGGSWTSSDTTVATIVSATGVVTGVSVGTANMTFMSFDGCTSITIVTVNPVPRAITGAGTICAGSSIVLSDPTSGGTWSSSNTSIATINPTTGVVTGVSGGSVTITYNLGTGCIATTTLSVNPNSPIVGIPLLCETATIALSDAISGGTWSSSNTSIATVDGSGIVTGVSAGAVTISYSLGTGCFTTINVTVSPAPLPGPITGGAPICTTSTTTLSDNITGGTWSSSNTSIATIGSGTGIVSGLSGGTVIITYSLGTGCITTTTLSVTPDPFSGNTSVCVGSTTTLSDAITGGTWSSGNTSIATVDASSGVVTGVVTGIATITYTLGTGCTGTTTITVNPLPIAISGTTLACIGSTITLSDGSGGGVWTSSNTSVAIIGSTSGVVTSITTGTTTVTYTLSTGCSITTTITVNSLPPTVPEVVSECAGSTTSLSDATGGGTWTSGNTSIATVDASSGVVTGVATGSTFVTYTLSTGCIATTTVTVILSPTPITGNKLICGGSTTTLSDNVSGGSWTSSNTTIATVDASTGVVTDISLGTVTITYTISTGCIATTTVTFAPTTSAIIGYFLVCIGGTTGLADGTSGGTWTSGNTSIATVDPGTGVVTGVTVGTAVITYTAPTGCFATATITVSPLPAPITGTTTVCAGSTIILSDATTPGIWSSGDPTIATIDPYTGVVYGVSGGTVTITFSNGCVTTTTVTINPTPPITGTTSVCAGSTTTLSNGTTGGTWSSSNTSIATVDASIGVVYGSNPGTTTITYTLPTGCISTVIVTVYPVPGAITGGSALCTGSTLSLSDPVTGGVWSSSNTSIATINPTSGVITGITNGMVTITYTIGGVCVTTINITINPDAPITGATSVCVGSTTTLSDAVTGGYWSSSNTTVAIIDLSTGVVTGISSGTATITYAPSTVCMATITVTVNPLPAIITGTTSVCTGGSTVTLSDVTAGGIWSSSNTSVATIGSSTGIVTGISSGNTIITYTLGTGCIAVTTVTVNSLPSTITGGTSVCVGSTITLSDATTGGTWSSNNTGVATIVSTTGIVHGVSAGTATITYTLGSGCIATATIIVNPLPAIITGTTSVCIGSTTHLSDATSGGTWSSSNTSVATIDPSTGIVTSSTTGTTVITYTLGTGCFKTTTVTVNSLPATITGIGSVCVGSSTHLSDATSGGSWTSSATSVATVVSTTGIVYGVSAGTTTITYKITATGCTAVMTVTVNPVPAIITGTAHVCASSTIYLSDATPGGTWTSSSTSVATIDPATGLVSGISAGTTTITYTLGTGCYKTVSFTVRALPNPIGGPSTVCKGSFITLSDGILGVWSTSSTTVSVIAGIVYGVSAGTGVITYTGLLTGCSVTDTITVLPAPVPIIGNITICLGSTGAFSDATPGGTWSIANTSIATIDPSGIIYTVSTGITSAIYTISNGCSASRAVIVVNPPAPVTGATICVGSSVTLSDATSGGAWSSSNSSVATIVSGTGVVTGGSSGTTTITYTAPLSGCTATTTVTVNPLPTAITGGSSLCPYSTITLSDAIGSGSWSSSNSSVATIDPGTGVVTGVSAGTTIITYTLGTGCITTITITVNPLPAVITAGAISLCVGSSFYLSDSTSGGSWSSSDTTVAIIDANTGIVTLESTGTATITYTLPTGCFITVTGTVSPLPGVIIGSTSVCVGATIALSDTTAGGAWSSSNSLIATIDPSSGIVTGVTAGNTIITYTSASGCIVTATVTVNPLTTSITGNPNICSGDSTILGNATGGGVWSSSNTLIATVNSTGIVYGVATGSATITYVATGPCGTFTVTAIVHVNYPPYITTHFIVACQTLPGVPSETDPGGTIILNDSTGCILVCDSTTVRYYANGDYGSAYTWVVTGGTVVQNYGDSIDISWGMAGTTGSITLYDTVSHCMGQATICIKVIQKPRAAFSSSALDACLGASITFHDNSIADPLSPIVSWYWTFGDGSSSPIENPSHGYTSAGTYTVTLVIKNQCNCSDTARLVINISAYPGPVISCASVVCDSATTTYSIPDTCTHVGWFVSGGTILSGNGSNTIVVKWDNVDPSGFGYVSVIDSCSLCSDTTTIKIPVVLENAAISGPPVVCAGQEYQYSLPLWPATQYMWGVLGYPSYIVSYHDDHTVTVKFDVPGTYTIHAWYQNRLLLCGGNVDTTITVVPPMGIVGPRTVCQSDTGYYTLIDSTLVATWTLTDPTGAVTTGSGYNFTSAFTTVGSYVLTATGAFCADPITIVVPATPGAIDSISGKDSVCIGRVYTYKAYTDIPGTIYNWHIVGGTVTPSSGSNVVSVIWTSYSAKQLTVSHVSVYPPYCEGPLFNTNIQTEIINPHVTGDTTPCSKGHRTYSANYNRGETYDWAIYPSSTGSIVSGNHDSVMNVLWNDVTAITSASVVVTVNKCDSVVRDTLKVMVQPSPGVVITASVSPSCPLFPVTFTATAGGLTYVWDFGDGSGGAGNSVTHSFPVNPTTGNMDYIVRVTVYEDPTALCPLSGFATFDMIILPGPIAYASSANFGWICPPATVVIVGTVTSNVSGLTYQWFNSGGTVVGTSVNYTTPSGVALPDIFHFVVTASNGCTDTSNGVYFDQYCAPGGGSGYGGSGGVSGGGGDGTPCGPLSATSADTCDVITLNGSAGTSPSWRAYATPDAGTGWIGDYYYGTTTTAKYDTPGIYRFVYTASTTGGCIDTIPIVDTIGIVVNYRYRLRCAAGNYDSVLLMDYSPYLSFWTIDTYAWDIGGTLLGYTANLGVTLPVGGPYAITETISGFRPGGRHWSCTKTLLITVPAKPVAAFTYATSPICENVPIMYSGINTGGIVTYEWDFGDGSNLLLQNVGRTYTWHPSAIPQPETVVLTVTDTIGCTADTTVTVDIYHNNLGGGYDGGGTICANAAPFIVGFTASGGTAAYSYTWSTGAVTVVPTLDVYTSGAYWVTVIDAHQCQQSFFPAENVKILQTPPAIIYGKQDYCIGDVVKLTGYAGMGVSYQWFRDGSLISTLPSIEDPGLALGDYQYQLVIAMMDTLTSTICYDSSVIDTVHMHPLPSKPTITGPTVLDCGLYHLQLYASGPGPVTGAYNWSNGVSGAVDDIYMGGPYRVWYTDPYGCTSYADTFVPLSPDAYFPYFPTGCYTLCKEQLPLTLYGPPDVTFNYWAWLMNSSIASSGTNSVMSPYNINTGGQYQWDLNNGLCEKISDTMDVTIIPCNKCQLQPFKVNIICDSSNPASYTIIIALFSPAAGTTYVLGTDIGPISPFSGTLPTAGPQPSMTLTFTTLYVPPPGSITIEVIFTLPSGAKCYQKQTIKLPPCGWIAEKNGQGNNAGTNDNLKAHIANSMLRLSVGP